MEKLERVKNIYIPERGIKVELPPTCSVLLNHPTGDILIEPKEVERIKAIMADPTLKKRYPKPEDGQRFMRETCSGWRNKLLDHVTDSAEEVGWECYQLGHERFSVILFGSTARNLIKKPNHPDPSNIDVAIIGEFGNNNRDTILNKLRPLRESLTSQIKKEEKSYECSDPNCNCLTGQNKSFTGSREPFNQNSTIDRLAILVQSTTQVRSNDYFSVRTHMSACARVLYDPTHLWKELETEASPHLAFYNSPPAKRKHLTKAGLKPQSAPVLFPQLVLN